MEEEGDQENPEPAVDIALEEVEPEISSDLPPPTYEQATIVPGPVSVQTQVATAESRL